MAFSSEPNLETTPEPRQTYTCARSTFHTAVEGGAFLRDLHLWHRCFSSDRNFSREINILNGIEQLDAFLHRPLKCLSTGD
jgi:hypothetical protein